MPNDIARAIEIGLIGGTAVTILLTLWTVRRVSARSPRAIVRRLESKGMPVQYRLRSLAGAWNPASSTVPGNLLVGPGRVTYELGADGTVHATLVGPTGLVKHVSGPAPDQLPESSPDRRRRRRLARGMVIGYPALVAVGFVVGFVVTSGKVVAKVVAGCIGIFAAMAVAAVLVQVLRVVLAVRGQKVRHDEPDGAA